MQDITYRWRDTFDNDAINSLHAEAFSHALLVDDWWGQVNRHSLGWACARGGDAIVGFVNLAWDGGVHAFVLDAIVAKTHRRLGIATRLIGICVEEARRKRCEWLHVDFEEPLAAFYLGSCDFSAAEAGLIRL
jgi:ribosomal protein S18 acetylase RimI-like enzyme